MTDPYGPPPPDPYAPQPPQPPVNPFATPANPYASPPANPYASPTVPTVPSAPPAPAYPATPYGQPQYQPGTPQYGPTPYGYAAPPTNSLALVSLILSLVGFVSLVSAPAGAIIGHVALRQIRRTGEAGEGMAKAGIIVGWIVTGIIALCCFGGVALTILDESGAIN
jgi:hypothetical protein